MKKILKRALTALIAAALLLSCLPLSSSADDLWVDADVDALWERKLRSTPLPNRFLPVNFFLQSRFCGKVIY